LLAAHALFAARENYVPPDKKSYAELKKIFPKLSQKEIDDSFSTNEKTAELINSILSFLKYRNICDKDIKTPPIYFVFSLENKELVYQGGMYFLKNKIIFLNANILNASKNAAGAANFINFSSILAHELRHHEDAVKKIENFSAILTEKNAYERSVKALDAFLRMNEDTADAVGIENFYEIVQANRGYIENMRRNYVLIMKAAGDLLKNKNEICKKLAINDAVFNGFSFVPEIQFNAKNGGHIVKVECRLSDKIQALAFLVDTISEEVELANSKDEIAAFKKQTEGIEIKDGKIYKPQKI